MTIPLCLSLLPMLTPPMLVITAGSKMILLMTNSSVLQLVSLSQKLISA